MPKINILSKATAELIAAGEVVERPASAIKEMIENSIDSGATRITVEIEGGGIGLMRVTDNGCGISQEDVPKAFLRHATSKIKTEDDLNNIGTLGFRGEALAAISTVSRVSMITAVKGEEMGTHYIIDGGNEVLLEEVGANVGTVIEVRDLFYNTPARMKFLKKDVKEGANVAAVVDRIALSHPEIAFEFIKDGKKTLTTQGNGNLKDAVYAVLGREIALGTIECDYTYEGVRVSGLICKPFKCRPNRNLQLTFLNGRFIKSKTAMAALDVGYKNSAMVGKFPYCVINIEVPPQSVDVNVHPAKTEVRFSNENLIFDAIRFSVKNALEKDSSRPEIKKVQTFKDRMTSREFLDILAEDNKPKTAPLPMSLKTDIFKNTTTSVFREDTDAQKPQNTEPLPKYHIVEPDYIVPNYEPKTIIPQQKSDIKVEEKQKDIPKKENDETKTLFAPPRFVGEVFKTYIIAEWEQKLYLIDKHATHERILFENQKESKKAESQMLLTPETVTLTKVEHSVIIENSQKMLTAGFELEDFGDGAILLRAVPSMLVGCDYASLLSEIAESLKSTNSVIIEKLERIYHTVACKAAVKAGYTSSEMQLTELMLQALTNPKIRYCPHGRPVAIELSQKELEKMFGRIQ